MEVIK